MGPRERYEGQTRQRTDTNMVSGTHQVICCCLAVPNQAEATRSAPSLDKERGFDAPSTGFADLYPWSGEIVSQPLVVFKETAELEFGHRLFVRAIHCGLFGEERGRVGHRGSERRGCRLRKRVSCRSPAQEIG